MRFVPAVSDTNRQNKKAGNVEFPACDFSIRQWTGVSAGNCERAWFVKRLVFAAPTQRG